MMCVCVCVYAKIIIDYLLMDHFLYRHFKKRERGVILGLLQCVRRYRETGAGGGGTEGE